MLYDMIIKKINYKCENETAGYSASYYRDLITLSLKFIYIAKAIFIKPHEWNSYMWNANTKSWRRDIQYIPRNMHTVFALLCFVVVIHLTDFPYPSGLLHWHCGNLAIAPVPAKQPWWILINTSCEFIMNDCITTTKQSTTKQCAYFLGYTVMKIH